MLCSSIIFGFKTGTESNEEYVDSRSSATSLGSGLPETMLKNLLGSISGETGLMKSNLITSMVLFT